MDWLLLLLRLLLGIPRREESEPQPVAVRPDGSTVTLPPGASKFSGFDRHRDWLDLFLSLGRQPLDSSSLNDHIAAAGIRRKTRLEDRLRRPAGMDQSD